MAQRAVSITWAPASHTDCPRHSEGQAPCSHFTEGKLFSGRRVGWPVGLGYSAQREPSP